MICTQCGYHNKAMARFCSRCGTALAAGGTPVSVQSQASRISTATGRLPASTLLCNRYMLRQPLGHGGMAAVYLADDLHLPGNLRAVKEMSEAALANPIERRQAIDGFRQEARELSSLSHPNIVRVYDFFTDAGKYFLVMEYVDGATLEDMLVRNGRAFQEAQVLSWLHQLCDALHYLHSQNPPIIFRDLKPSNIMVDRNGSIKLIDFGIARRFDPHKASDTTALGTEGYAAPEQYGRGQTDARSDIYALGVTAHRLLTGSDPSDQPFNLPAVRSLNAGISQPLASTVDQCLRADPAQRPQRVADIQRTVTGLLPAAGSQTGASFAPRSGSPTVQVSKRPTTRLVQAAARLSSRQLAALLGGGLGGLALAIWLFAPWIERNFPALWYEVPAFMIAGPIAHAATRRLGPAFVAQVVVTLVVFLTAWARFGTWTYEPQAFLLGVTLSAILYEISFHLLDHRTNWAQTPDKWQREVGWYAVTAVIATICFFLPWYLVRFQGGLWVWLNTALVGAAGWFVGDLLQQGMAQRLWTRFRSIP